MAYQQAIYVGLRSLPLEISGAHTRFRPSFLNAAAGLLTTFVNIYTSRGGQWSVMAIVTTVVTGPTFLISFSLLVVYRLYKLRRIILEDEAESRGYTPA